jgi:hypothetical protein
MGAAGGSGMAGGISSLSAQLGSSLGYQTQMTGLTRNISQLGQQAAGFEAQSALFAGQAQLFGGIQQMTGVSTRDAFSGLFA